MLINIEPTKRGKSWFQKKAHLHSTIIINETLAPDGNALP